VALVFGVTVDSIPDGCCMQSSDGKVRKGKTMDRTAKIEFNNDSKLIVHDISRFEQREHKLKIYRGPELGASLDKDDIKKWYVRSGYDEEFS
jgi:hypothetical protein